MLTFSHGNRDGTGSQMTVEVVYPVNDEQRQGYALVAIHPQNREQALVLPDEKHAFVDEGIVIPLSVKGVAFLLAVLDGEEPGIMGGRGVRANRTYDRRMATISAASAPVAVLHCDRVTTPYRGYAVHIKRMGVDNGSAWCKDGRIVLNDTEGKALLDSLRSHLGRMAFGA